MAEFRTPFVRTKISFSENTPSPKQILPAFGSDCFVVGCGAIGAAVNGGNERGGMGGGDGAWARKKMSHFGTTTIVVAAFIQFPLYGHPSWGIPRPFPYPFFFLFRSPRPLSALSLSPALFSLFRFCAPSPAFCFQASTHSKLNIPRRQ